MATTLGRFLLGTLVLACAIGADDRPPLPAAQPNSNLRPAGRIHKDTLRIALVVRMATWAPDGEHGPSVAVPTFGEHASAPQIPGPLIRVPVGTMVDASVRNDLPDSVVTVHGLFTRPAPTGDSLVIQPGQTARVRFPAGAPGTYLYYAEVGRRDTLLEREQLAGVFVVDSAGARRDDRIFVINIWGEPVDSVNRRNALAINGRSFPHGEQITAQMGDTLRWRWVNASRRNHPMHLHGFYFSVDAKGDTVFASGVRRMAVTENLAPRQTMRLTWSPDRPGNWLFHCHLLNHVLPGARLGSSLVHEGHGQADDMSRHMAGLVLPIVVRPSHGWQEPTRGQARALRLFVQEGRPRGLAPRAMGFVLQRGTKPPATDSVEIPGSVLVLTRGEPTDITVINRLPDPTAVHWHGLELESYSDGVAGWSGIGHRRAPIILSGDSFTARLTLRRAGSFIYHTHLNDLEQLTSGLYGALLVLEPGRRFDPKTDHVYVAGWDGPARPPHILVNGDSVAPPLELAVGVTHRFRFINIGMAVPLRFSLSADSVAAVWRLVARDGAELPGPLAKEGPAVLSLPVGSTAEYEFLPQAPGTYRLTATPPGRPSVWRQVVMVR